MAIWKIDMEPGFIFGSGVRKQFGTKLKELGATKAMIVYDAVMGKLGFTDELVKLAEVEGISVVTYETELGEPASSKVDRAVEFAKQHAIDALVGFGGGSSMDTAKLVGKVLANGGRCADYLGYTNTSGNAIFEPILTIPTTAGTGAEINHGCVCENEDIHVKAVTLHKATLALIDPDYTVGLPPAVTAFTGVDAMTHALECICNTESMTNWFSDMMCRDAMRLCFKWLPIAYADGKNIEARSCMSYAATIAGYAIKQRKTTIGHAIANQISDKYHLPHGVGCGLGMYVVTRYNIKGNPTATRIIAESIGIPCDDNSDWTKIGQLVSDTMDNWQKNLGMKTWKEAGLDKDFADLCYEKIKADKKWTIVTPPDFELMREAMYSALEL